MNVILVGDEAAGVQVLRAIAQRSHQLVAVLAPANVGSQVGSLAQVASALGYRTMDSGLVTGPDWSEAVREWRTDLILNVYSLQVIHPAVLAAPSIGCFNLHPGPLPEYAGLDTVSWAILRGEVHYGVTVHHMVADIDAGPIAFQQSFPVSATDTALSLSARCVREGVRLVLRLLDVADRSPLRIPAMPQDLARRRYYRRGIPWGGRMSFRRPADEVVRFVRACDYYPLRSPWGHPRVGHADRSIGVVKAYRTGSVTVAPPGTVGALKGGIAQVAALDEWIDVSHLMVSGRVVQASEELRPGDVLADGV